MKNIKDFKPTTLDGELVNVADLNRIIGNAIYFSASDISVCEISRKIYKEEDFEPTTELLSSIQGTARGLAPWLIDQFTEFLKQ